MYAGKIVEDAPRRRPLRRPRPIRTRPVCCASRPASTSCSTASSPSTARRPICAGRRPAARFAARCPHRRRRSAAKRAAGARSRSPAASDRLVACFARRSSVGRADADVASTQPRPVAVDRRNRGDRCSAPTGPPTDERVVEADGISRALPRRPRRLLGPASQVGPRRRGRVVHGPPRRDARPRRRVRLGQDHRRAHRAAPHRPVGGPDPVSTASDITARPGEQLRRCAGGCSWCSRIRTPSSTRG